MHGKPSIHSTTLSLLQVFSGKPLTPPPVWLMRQAGRYLPEYRDIRAKADSFLDLCFDPLRATEITLQPVRRFDLDAAILFSDILVVPYALGRTVSFVENEGPRLDPIDRTGIDQLAFEAEKLAPVVETVARVRGELEPTKSLIGFCGAPWTVATYMVAGRGTVDQMPARRMATADPDAFQVLIDRLVDASVSYLVAQLRAGADLVQVFDSWAGVLNDADFDRWSVAPTREIVRRVRAEVPEAIFVGFPRGAGLRYERYVARTGVDAISIDWMVPLSHARDRLQPLAVVQGNLDPVVLLFGDGRLDDAIDAILSGLGGGRFIFNLGHGVLPETPVDHVARLVARVRGWRG